jgi:hypothetical protein
MQVETYVIGEIFARRYSSLDPAVYACTLAWHRGARRHL